MAEIKHSFQAGKMNKDLDERLVPQGEYRDALNIEVRTSDGGDVGTVQNLYGNKERLSDSKWGNVNPTVARNGQTSTIVGSVTNEKTNKVYFFISAPKQFNYGGGSVDSKIIFKDMIVEYDNIDKTIRPVVTDIFRVEFPASHFGTISGSASTPYNKITITGDFATETLKLLRPGMRITAHASGSSASLMQNSPVDFNLNGLDYNPTIDKIVGNQVYFDRFVTGDLSNTVSWVVTIDTVLNFGSKITSNNLITGINIVDNLLFWTDNESEPKKINIDRCKASFAVPAGDNDLSSFDEHSTLLITDAYQNYSNISTIEPNTDDNLIEEHITVIRRAPRVPPTLIMSEHESGKQGVDIEGVTNNFTSFIVDDEIVEPGTELSVLTSDGIDLLEGDIIIMESDDGDEGLVSARCEVLELLEPWNDGASAFSMKVLSISSIVNSSHVYWTIKLEQRNPYFELKFGRFAYRYKYEDGEYSPFSPWSELAFLPGEFDYIPKKGYNLGMVNNLRSLKIADFIVDDDLRPDDISEVDILYKDTVSPNVYVVKTIRRHIDPEWNTSSGNVVSQDTIQTYLPSSKGVVNITSEMIHRTLHSSQSLRAWDNVPRVAKAQEVTGNRIVYGNYLQNYNVDNSLSVIQVLNTTDHPGYLEGPFTPYKSLKSIRRYKVGVVLGDKYGRETPILLATGSSTIGGSVKPIPQDVNVPKKNAWRINKLDASVKWNGEPPAWAEYYKFYIKETSNEYYNLAMDRWYKAEDGNIWLSFQSADRNKVDIETYLTLKNVHGGQTPVEDVARYKILAIENEAPDFIKTTNKILGAQQMVSTTNFAGLHQTMMVTFEDSQWDAAFSGVKFEGIGFGRIRAIESGNVKYSKWVKISRIKEPGFDGDVGSVTLMEPFGDSADMAANFGVADASDIDSYEFEMKDSVVENRPEFDGKFFIKVMRDATLATNVLGETADGMTYNAKWVEQIAYVGSKNPNHLCNQNSDYQGDYTSLAPDATPAATSSSGNGNTTDHTWSNSHISNADDLGVCDHNHDTENFWDAYWHADATYTKWFLDASYTASEDGQGGVQSGLHAGTLPASANIEGLDKMQLSVIGDGNELNYGNEVFLNYMSTPGTLFRFAADPFDTIYQVQALDPEEQQGAWTKWNYHKHFDFGAGESCKYCDDTDVGGGGEHGASNYVYNCRRRTFKTRFVQANDPSKGVITSIWDPRSAVRHDGHNTMGIEIVEAHFDLSESIEYAQGNAVWETEPKEDLGMDLYYEATGALPLYLKDKNATSHIPIGCRVEVWRDGALLDLFPGSYGVIRSVDRDIITIRDVENSYGDVAVVPVAINDVLRLFHTNGMVTEVTVIDHWHATEYRTSDSYFVENDVANNSVGSDWSITNGPGGGTSGGIIIRGNTTWISFANSKDHGYLSNLKETLIGVDGDYTDGVLASGLWSITSDDTYQDDSLDITGSTNPLAVKYIPDGTFMSSYVGENADEISIGAEPSSGEFMGIFNAPWFGGGNSIDNESTHELYTYSTDSIRILRWAPGVWDPSGHGNNWHPQETFGININDHGQAGYPNVYNQFNSPYGPANISVTFKQVTGHFRVDHKVYHRRVTLPWFNCYSFGNGLESDRIRDDFNAPQIDNGGKVTSVLDNYGEERRSSGMIYSGIYNSTSGVNNLNEFNMAEAITKDLNPSYGSIQALKTRDTNVVAFCEDKVFKILANKDSLYNADGSANVTASSAVLGDAQGFVGDFGISLDPSSLAMDGYRMYFTDRQRNKVLRLSQDGLTPISDVGMISYFRENLKHPDYLIGSFDEVKGEYNLTMSFHKDKSKLDNPDPDYATLPIEPITVSFSEKTKGWTSFKSFIPEVGVSINEEYITGKDARIWSHHDSTVDANTFYGEALVPSTIDVLFNENPGAVKSFSTINYEGTQALVNKFTETDVTDATGQQLSNINDGEYYSIFEKSGWWVESFNTDMQEARIGEFIEKEGKWFNNINGIATTLSNLDTNEFTVQGIGVVGSVTAPPPDKYKLTIIEN